MGFDGDDDWALSDDGGNLILAGGDHVVDDLADDLEALRSGRLGFKDTSMFPALPPLHLGRYDEAFAKAFLAATRAVAAKLRLAYEEGWPYPSEGLLGSVADELAMEAILVGAEAQDELRMEVLSPSRRAQLKDESETLREVSFNDRDLELLFESCKDGALEDPGLEAQMGILNLRFADWFLPSWEDYDPLGSDADDGESA
jgi:hypothetical protein